MATPTGVTTDMMPSGGRAVTTLLALVAILAIGGALRLHGVNWDAGQHLHPDERFLAIVGDKIRFPERALDYFDTRGSPLNPYNQGFEGYAYGMAPLFLTRWVAEQVGMATYDRINLVGRVLSAVFDLGTVALTFALGSLVYGRATGLLAAALIATTVLHIQLSHFFAVDTFLAFATTLALISAYRAWLFGGPANFALLGLAIGIAAATKLSAVLLLPVVGLVVVVPPPNRRPMPHLAARAGWLALCGVMALLVYRVGEPYSFAGTDFFGFLPSAQRFADLDRWVKISSGEIEVPFMIQWAGTPNPWFALGGIVQWGLGPAAGLCSLLGLGVTAWQMRRWSSGGRSLLLVAWSLINLLYFGFQFAKFLRYFLPLYPVLAILGACLLVRAAERLGHHPWRSLRLVARAAPAVVLATTLLYALMFSTIYARPHTRIAASEWIYANVPAGATLAVEHWDDALPLRLPGRDRNYTEVSLELYADESPEKAQKLAESLRRADYVFLSSDRLVESIPRLPSRFPIAIEYYRLLLGGELGFDQIAEFTSGPTMFGFTIDDTTAQEDFTVYDHPRVRIFKKSSRFSGNAVAARLIGVPLDDVERVKPVDAGARRGLMLPPREWEEVRRSGTWSSSFDLDGIAATLPIPAWLLVVELLALAAFPLCWWLFRQLPDVGFALAKVVGLALATYLAWLSASVGLFSFGRGLALTAAFAIAAISAAVAARHREAMLRDLIARRGLLLTTELVFLGALVLMLLLRAANPDLWHSPLGGEKPMDFAYLNAVIKSPSFPPYDPWFSGGYLNYYYYGFVLIAVLTHLSSVPPAQAYNLAVATIFALSAVTAFAFGVTVAGRARAARSGQPSRSTYGAGLLSAAALCLFGNLDGVLQLRDGLWKLGGEGVPSVLPLVTGTTRVLIGVAALLRGGALPPFDFWRSTRFIGPEDPGPIHEFPYFTFMFGDLHAHMISMPLQVAVALIALAIVRTRWLPRPDRSGPEGNDRLRRWLPSSRLTALLMLAALLVGSLRATNTWDFPTYLLVTGAAVFFALRPGRTVSWLAAAAASGAACSAIYLISSILYLPYLARYELFYSGVLPVLARTDLGQFLTIHGFFLLIGLVWLTYHAVGGLLPNNTSARAVSAPRGYYGLIVPAVPMMFDPRVAVTAVLLAVVVVTTIAGRGVLGMVVATGLLGLVVAIKRPLAAERLFLMTLAAAALAAVTVPELVAVRGDVGRMNTVFKFYLQAWILASLLAGPAAFHLLRIRSSTGRDIGPNQPVAPSRTLAVALVAVAVVALIYPFAATPSRLSQRFSELGPTLDGMAYMAHASYSENRQDLALPADYLAIRWMLENVDGTPVILEGQAPLYRWGSRFSVYTGLPTIIGWDWHQKQQRWTYHQRIEERERDVKQAYESRERASAAVIIRKYGVSYIVVGGLERAYYPLAGLEKFEQMVGSELEVAYRAEGVTVYRVIGS